MGSVRQPEMLSFPLFDHVTITGEKTEYKTIAIADEAANYSSVFDFDDFVQNTLGIIGLAIEFNGNASDTIVVIVEFLYGERLTWGAKSMTLLNGVAGNTNQFVRLDIQSTWRDYLPFQKMRFKITKTGTNAAGPILARFTRI